MMKEKLLCLIDAQNLYYTPKKTYNSQLDFYKLLRRISKEVGPFTIDAIAYLVADAVVNQAPFITLLQRFGYQTRLKLIQHNQGEIKNTNWDSEIIQDARLLMPDYAGIILASGDCDFLPMLDEWTAARKKTYIFCFRQDAAHKVVTSRHHPRFLGQDVIYQHRPQMAS